VIDVVADQRGNPTFAPDLAAVILQIAAPIVAEPAASD
jgi:dTDP-4-dehydrorhamnose reductase